MTFREIAAAIAAMSEYDKDCEALVKVSGFELKANQPGVFVSVTGTRKESDKYEVYLTSDYDTEQYTSS